MTDEQKFVVAILTILLAGILFQTTFIALKLYAIHDIIKAAV